MNSSTILGNILKKSTLDNDKLPIPRSKSEKNLSRFLKNKEKIKSKLRKLIGVFDNFTNARTTLFFVIIFYFLGKGLNILVLTLLCIYAYLLTFRLIRFWVKNSLMYMLDFVYFGNLSLIIFLLFFKKNLNVFLAVFSISANLSSED